MQVREGHLGDSAPTSQWSHQPCPSLVQSLPTQWPKGTTHPCGPASWLGLRPLCLSHHSRLICQEGCLMAWLMEPRHHVLDPTLSWAPCPC